MKPSAKYVLNVSVTGICTLFIVSIVLFWVRWIPNAMFTNLIDKHLAISISPSGLMPEEIENDPNIVQPSHIVARPYDLISLTSGMYNDIVEAEAEVRFGTENFYGISTPKDAEGNYSVRMTYFNKSSGLFVYCRPFKKHEKNITLWDKEILLYAGPNGISQKPDKKIGRFTKPMINIEKDYSQNIIFYDTVLRRFFEIDFDKETVRKGHQIKSDALIPVQFGRLSKNDYVLNLNWKPPLIKGPKTKTSRNLSGLIPVATNIFVDSNYLVLDKTGRIYQLDYEKLSIGKAAGFLPKIFGETANSEIHGPRDLLAYKILQLVEADRRHAEHKGLITAAINREGMRLSVSVFDQDGKQINWKIEDIGRPEETPGMIAWTTSKYLFENLQPPAFSLASFVTAKIFEASSGHKALFILPNSIVSIIRRESGDAVVSRLLIVSLVFLAPSWILSMCLTLLVRKNATLVGISKRARIFWTVATLALGLIAYITYRLTRPKITMVTCANCGKLRRPDFETCHRCGGKWKIPELKVPLWTVIDNQ